MSVQKGGNKTFNKSKSISKKIDLETPWLELTYIYLVHVVPFIDYIDLFSR